MKNSIIIDIDTDRTESPVVIGKPSGVTQPANFESALSHWKQDVSTVCEGLCTLIHVGEQAQFAPSSDTLRNCIDHLQKGFADASYEGHIVVPVPTTEDTPQERPPHQQRVLDEKAALDEKITKLSAFLDNPPVLVPAAETKRLEVQLGFMRGYSTVLAERIAAF